MWDLVISFLVLIRESALLDALTVDNGLSNGAEGRQVWAKTDHIVGANKILECEGGGESGVGRQVIGMYDAEQRQRILRFGSLLLEGILS